LHPGFDIREGEREREREREREIQMYIHGKNSFAEVSKNVARY